MDMEKDDMQLAKQTLYTLILGTIVSGLFFGALGSFLVSDWTAFFFGSLLGVVTACGIAVHLYKTIEKSLDLEADFSVSYTRRMALLRLLLMGLPVILAVLLPDRLHPLGVLAGLLGLKAGALLQPVALRLTQKRKKKVRESAE